MDDSSAPAHEAGGHGGLIIYCRTWCPDCRRAKAWLEQEGIPFVEIDVDEDPVARDRAAQLNEGRLHTPTFERGAEKCIDFHPDRIRELLELP